MQDVYHQSYVSSNIPQNPIILTISAPNKQLSKPGPNTPIINPIKLETGLRPTSAGIPYTLLLRIEAMGFPTFGLLL